jgi:CcmD family protein
MMTKVRIGADGRSTSVAGSTLIALCLVLAFTAAAVAPLAAQQPAGQNAQDEFVPVKSLPQGEQLPAAPLLIAAYVLVWVALLVYLWTIGRRLSRVHEEMRALAGRLDDRSQAKKR